MTQLSREMLRDRFRGALLGVAIGDALGLPFEGLPPGSCARAQLTEDFAARPRGGKLAKGQWGEGTACALAVAEAFAGRASLDGADIARRIQHAWTSGEIPVAGRALREAMEKLEQGQPWNTAGAPTGRAGNGPAVRSIALGLWCAFEPRKLPRDAQMIAVITHKDPRAAAGAAAIGAAVAFQLAGGRSSRECVRHAAEAARQLDRGIGDDLATVEELLSVSSEAAAIQLSRLGLSAGDRPQPGISTFVLPSVGFALHCALRADGDLRVACEAAIRAGGDVDAVSAMAGAIVGARVGAAQLPARLKKGVRDPERIVRAADALLAARLDGVTTTRSIASEPAFAFATKPPTRR